MNNGNELVREFHEKFGHPIDSIPNIGTVELRMLRATLLLEEVLEFIAACGLTIYKDEDGYHVTEDKLGEVDIVEMADALGDIRYVTDGANLVFGFPQEKILVEIHESNMSKLGVDGKPIVRADGKILKGPNYFKPNIRNILQGEI